MELTTESPVRFTQKATDELLRLMNGQDFEKNKWLRIGVKGGGCSGLSYVLGFDERQENDEVYTIDGLQYIMNPAHGIYLAGMEINWEDGLNARGFTFANPNASKTCGCGSSFAV